MPPISRFHSLRVPVGCAPDQEVLSPSRGNADAGIRTPGGL
jgi:hypothetical protein